MFKKLADFSCQRSTRQAIGFYLAYLLLLLIICPAAQTILETLFNIPNPIAASLVTVVAVIVSVTLCILISSQKHLFRDYKALFLIILSGLLASISGGFGGLIPAAYLSTFKKPA